MSLAFMPDFFNGVTIMNEELSFYNPKEISLNDKKELQEMKETAFGILSKAAMEKYNFPNIKLLRNEYKKNQKVLWANPLAAKWMNKMIAAEATVISGYILIGANLSRKFNKNPEERIGVTLMDYLQQCAHAIYDSMYMYDGSTEFSTYVTHAMRHRLISFVYKEELDSGVGRKIMKMRTQVKKIMRDRTVNFEQALSVFVQNNKIDNTDLSLLRHSMRKKSHINQDYDSIEISTVDKDSLELKDMFDAIEKAPLDEMQRRLIDAYINGDKDFRRKVTESEINPKTGNLWTKAWLSKLFLDACKTIRNAYNRKNRAA